MSNKFIEQQKFTQWWIWAIMLGLFSIVAFAFFNAGFYEAMVSFVVVILVNLLFLSLKLRTEINEKEIRMAYFPFIKKQFNWSVVKSIKVFDYGFVGGWGIRFWTKYGTVYNIRGSKGILVELNDDKTFVIGTQNEEEVKVVLNKLGKINE